MKQIVIASKNPVKVNAVKEGFNKMFPGEQFEYKSLSVDSGVSEQPMTNNETKKGAFQRALNAQSIVPEANYWVGIEGGLQPDAEDMEAFAWIVIISGKTSGKARTSTFFLPKEVIKHINEGKELGEADDIVFGHSNSKQKNGAVGLLTNNVVTRTTYYTQAVILALIPFKNPKLY